MANDFFDLKTNFQPIILSTTPTKHHRQYDKLIHDLEKSKKSISKPEINLKQKILSRSDLFFLAISRLKKTL
jgi:hypothetical protein